MAEAAPVCGTAGVVIALEFAQGAWPSPAVTMSSSLVRDPPRDGSRVLYAWRSPGSGESPLTNISEFLCRWLRACSRTSLVLAGESHLPGVSGVAQPLLAPLLAPLTTALRGESSPHRFITSRTRFDTLRFARCA